MDRRIVALVAAVAAVVGVRLGTPAEATVPLISVPQGVSAHSVGGKRIFILREGTLTLTGFSARSPSGDELVWCADEEVFLAVRQGDLFTEEGRWVAGPSDRDMDRVRLRVTDALDLVVGKVVRAGGRTRGEVPGEIGVAYDRWLNPRSYEEPVPFCESPLR